MEKSRAPAQDCARASAGTHFFISIAYGYENGRTIITTEHGNETELTQIVSSGLDVLAETHTPTNTHALIKESLLENKICARACK